MSRNVTDGIHYNKIVSNNSLTNTREDVADASATDGLYQLAESAPNTANEQRTSQIYLVRTVYLQSAWCQPTTTSPCSVTCRLTGRHLQSLPDQNLLSVFIRFPSEKNTFLYRILNETITEWVRPWISQCQHLKHAPYKHVQKHVFKTLR